jgi:peptidoglycan/xylan/chitin deacetylase (PgdA/CDA1 family)
MASGGSGGVLGSGGSAADAAPSAGGSVGAGGSTSSGGVSGLPTPPGGGVPKPMGPVGDPTVLSWAGFKAAVSWTFDDSQPSQIEHYAELQSAGVPLTFYLTTSNSGEAGYDAAFTQAIKDGHELGNHTVSHCRADLTGCGTALRTLDAELDQCTSYITQHYPQKGVWTAASPFGDTGYDSLDQARFLANRGVGSGMIGANDNTDAFNLPCHAAASGETMSSFNSAIDSAHASGKWLIFLVHTITPTSANWYNPVGISDVIGGIGHGKSLTDVWNDTVVSIAAYWRAQKMFGAIVPTTTASGKTWAWTLPAHFPPGHYLRVKVGGGTLKQGGTALAWNDHGYYEVALDAGMLTVSP